MNQSISTLEANTVELKAKEIQLLEQLDARYGEYRDALIEFLSRWYTQEVQNIIVAKSQITEKLHLDGALIRFKEDLNKLVTSLPDLVAEELYFQGPPHRRQVEVMFQRRNLLSSYLQKDFITQEFGDCISRLGDRLGVLLLNYGFREKTATIGSWQWNQVLGRLHYTRNLFYPPSKKEMLRDDYYQLYDQLLKSHFERRKIEKVIADMKAKDLWDQI